MLALTRKHDALWQPVPGSPNWRVQCSPAGKRQVRKLLNRQQQVQRTQVLLSGTPGEEYTPSPSTGESRAGDRGQQSGLIRRLSLCLSNWEDGVRNWMLDSQVGTACRQGLCHHLSFTEVWGEGNTRAPSRWAGPVKRKPGPWGGAAPWPPVLPQRTELQSQHS